MSTGIRCGMDFNLPRVQTVNRWLKTVLGNAGFDTSIFKALSTRGARTSKANMLELSVE